MSEVILCHFNTQYNENFIWLNVPYTVAQGIVDDKKKNLHAETIYIFCLFAFVFVFGDRVFQ